PLDNFKELMKDDESIESTVTLTPLPVVISTDRLAVLDLIVSGQVQTAFEMICNQADESALQVGDTRVRV
ncbi:hypothetical protein PENTCL1PPCAC_24209, partial [Pristionchus entomophagus]